MIQRLLGIVLICAHAVTCLAQPEVRGAVGGDELSGVLAGIVHYTRWPDAPSTLRVCVDARDELASGPGAQRLSDALAALGARTITIEGRRLDIGAAGVKDCQALYVGDAPASTWQALLTESVAKPVLTIGYGEEFCSRGGLFCLERATPELHVRANLDSISRSGLRVNPQLLRLTQRDTRAGR